MITAEVAIYPLKTNNASDVINESISTLKGSNVSYSVNPINTRLTGSDDDVFNSLEAMYSAARRNGGEINMVVTISNAAGPQ